MRSQGKSLDHNSKLTPVEYGLENDTAQPRCSVRQS